MGLQILFLIDNAAGVRPHEVILRFEEEAAREAAIELPSERSEK
jgi:hypothetical protein